MSYKLSNPAYMFLSTDRDETLYQIMKKFYSNTEQAFYFNLKILTEIVDNAAKFSINDDSPVDVEICSKNEKLILTVSNRMSEYQAEHFSKIAEVLTTAHPDELYIDKVAGFKGSICDGIGLISIKKYYNINIDFKFSNQNSTYTVAVTAEFIA